MSQGKPFTVKSFQDYLREKKLMGNSCDECKNLMIPPRMLCTKCRGKKLSWSQFRGEGSLETFTIVHVPPSFLKDKTPYAIGIVRLDEGPKVTARLVNVDVERPETIKMSMRVIVEYMQEGTQPFLGFKPA